MKKILRILLIVLLFVSMSCEKELMMGGVAGNIYFAGTKIPVPNVTVSLKDIKTQSNEDGAYEVRNSLGRYKLNAEKDGFDDYSEEIEVIHGTIELDIEMNSPEFTSLIYGTLRGNHTGELQEGIKVLLLNPDETESEIQDYSDNLGNYKLEGVPFGERMILVVIDGIIVFQELVFLESSSYQLNIFLPEPFTFIDTRDGHEYWALKIGTQTWMIENLAWMPAVTGPANGSYLEPQYYVSEYYGSNLDEARNSSNYQKYGVLYNWVAAKSSCPEGWHLPSDEEWKILEAFLGIGNFDAISDGARRTGEVGRKLKSDNGWVNNGNGDNSSRFNALPVGSRFDSGGFDLYGYRATMWTSTPSSDVFAWSRGFGSTVYWVDRDRHDIQNGHSVRCISDR